MARRATRAGLILGSLMLIGVGSARALEAQPPACTEANAGQLSVQATVQCQCAWFPESRMAGTPAGWRWDCSILRARMNQIEPATSNPYPYPLPDALSIERTILGEPRPFE